MEVGQEWAYRAKQRDPVVQVKVLRIGTNRPPRVLVRFVADQFEGREEWVPPARLKTLWSRVDDWLASEARWTALHDASWRHGDDAELLAAELILDGRSSLGCVSIGGSSDNGILFINDLDALSAKLNLDASELTRDPLCIQSGDGTWACPFSMMLTVAKRAAQVLADEILAEVAKEERKARQRAIHGEYHGSRRGEEYYFRPEVCAEVDQRYIPAWRLMREWCGQDAVEQHTELSALREEVFRLGKLVERAITALAKHDKATAQDLEKELGVPIETLQRSQRPND
ncbi:hypothetical protein JOF56_003040 [Kibdelosporangium banguiense]|uniref:Uncharacterized protein n=1 Tax=Kibdelosporangium banguiense TaxID=1365924 RepID=A0ABS4TEZ4_9PSEU|nr:hypothetical protein [Kibdelosporangium banguiense]MBP2322655.1 hypothetical protein [Kibdelosporangium banguiense]